MISVRAEARCGEALQELESMKSDMVTLVQQLSDSEIRRLNAEAAVTDHNYQVNEVQPPVPQSLTSTVGGSATTKANRSAAAAAAAA